MALTIVAEDYFRTINPIAEKIHQDITETKNAYEHIWDTLTEKEKEEVINESIIKPDIALKYALLDTLDFDLNDPLVRKDDLMAFFGREHGQKLVQEDNHTWHDEHSAPFLFQTKSQLNLCILSGNRSKKDLKPSQELSELAISHSKVVSELKNALKSHEMSKISSQKKYEDKETISSPSNFLSKLIGNKFKCRDEEQERLVMDESHIEIVPSENIFRVNYKSPSSDNKFEKDYRCSIVKSNSDLSEENRGLLSSVSRGSSGTEFLSCEDLGTGTASTETLTTSTLPKTGYDFLDNW
ncbi:Uncharacterized protein C1orf198 homolog [Eumeta japonica]|uniref:Uncharacterized protein C1orf198 homolog n=1 Tax=Eumeta variegata TaxID=151549 RepID=A0A4C1UYT1_EUMVA|nr:Uncharacterized protein C1orf198 homolog [Eumeta japonica]